MKGKFRFHYANGETMIDRNGYKTLAAASNWVRASNRGTRTKGWKIVKITKVKR